MASHCASDQCPLLDKRQYICLPFLVMSSASSYSGDLRVFPLVAKRKRKKMHGLLQISNFSFQILRFFG